MGAQYSTDSSVVKVAYPDLDHVVCEASLAGESRVPNNRQQTSLFTRPILFRYKDEEIVFRARNGSETLSELRLLRFGCW